MLRWIVKVLGPSIVVSCLSSAASAQAEDPSFKSPTLVEVAKDGLLITAKEGLTENSIWRALFLFNEGREANSDAAAGTPPHEVYGGFIAQQPAEAAALKVIRGFWKSGKCLRPQAFLACSIVSVGTLGLVSNLSNEAGKAGVQALDKMGKDALDRITAGQTPPDETSGKSDLVDAEVPQKEGLPSEPDAISQLTAGKTPLPPSVGGWSLAYGEDGRARASVKAQKGKGKQQFSRLHYFCKPDGKLGFSLEARNGGKYQFFVYIHQPESGFFGGGADLKDNEIANRSQVVQFTRDIQRLEAAKQGLIVISERFEEFPDGEATVFPLTGFTSVRDLLLKDCSAAEQPASSSASPKPLLQLKKSLPKSEYISVIQSLDAQRCKPLLEALAVKQLYIYPLPRDRFLRFSQCSSANGMAYLSFARQGIQDSPAIGGKLYFSHSVKFKSLAVAEAEKVSKSSQDAEITVSVMMNRFLEGQLDFQGLGLVTACIAKTCGAP